MITNRKMDVKYFYEMEYHVSCFLFTEIYNSFYLLCCTAGFLYALNLKDENTMNVI